jgi:hypothetical protein
MKMKAIEDVALKTVTWIVFTLWLPLFYLLFSMHYISRNWEKIAALKVLGTNLVLPDTQTLIWKTAALLVVSFVTLFLGARHFVLKGKAQEPSGRDVLLAVLLIVCYLLGSMAVVLFP